MPYSAAWLSKERLVQHWCLNRKWTGKFWGNIVIFKREGLDLWVKSHSSEITLLKSSPMKNQDTSYYLLFHEYRRWCFLSVILLVCVSLDAHFTLTWVDLILAGESHQALVEYFRLSAPNSIYYIFPCSHDTPMSDDACTDPVSHDFVLEMTPMAFFSWSLKNMWEKQLGWF